jgi:heptosyltransferase-2
MTDTQSEDASDEVRFDCRHYNGYKPCGRWPVCDFRCPKYEARGPRILMIKLGAMGDVLRTTPVLRALKASRDPSHVTWITDPESEFLLRHNPLVDRLLLWSPDSVLILQASNFDLCLNFEKEDRALALDRLVRAVEKRGFALHPAGTLGFHNAASEYALRLGIDDDLKFRKNKKTMPQILMEMAGFPFQGEEYVLELGPRATAFAAEFAGRHSLAGAGPVVGLNTGCGAVFPTKQWPVENFIRLVDLLHRRRGLKTLLLGGPREREINAEILRRVPPGSLIDSGCDHPLEDFLGVVENCDLVVSSDSLAMHLAIARRKWCVALLGPTSATEIDLYGRGETLKSDFDCAPCYRKDCGKRPNCMDALAPEAVFEAIERGLDRLA